MVQFLENGPDPSESDVTRTDGEHQTNIEFRAHLHNSRVCSGETNLQIHQTLCLVNGYEFCPSLLSHRILL